jgi:hypothetical protein
MTRTGSQEDSRRRRPPFGRRMSKPFTIRVRRDVTTLNAEQTEPRRQGSWSFEVNDSALTVEREGSRFYLSPWSSWM